MPEFKSVLYVVVGLVVFSAFMATGISIVGAFFQIPFSEELVEAFIESFKAGLAALVGLLAGAVSQSQKAP